MYLLAHWLEGALSGEHHRGSSGTEPEVVLGSLVADDATDGHEQAIKGGVDQYMVHHDIKLETQAYPKVAPEPSMYLPSVRMTPLGPAPYWKMVTVPMGGKLLFRLKG